MPDDDLSFPAEFDQELALELEGNRAYFGRDVLRGLIEGIDDFVRVSQPRWRQYGSAGSALLASAMWIDDAELIATVKRLSAACVVVTKQGRTKWDGEKLERLREHNDDAPGLPIRAFPLLGGLAPKEDGEPAIVGPYGDLDSAVLPTFRTLGFRKREHLVPIVHAKLALLGSMWWHDEHPSGALMDVMGFTPRRLWVGSANFTERSRRSLEFGYWTEAPPLLEGAKGFLLRLIEHSEDLDPESDSPDPTLAPVEYDDEAIAEALADSGWQDPDECSRRRSGTANQHAARTLKPSPMDELGQRSRRRHRPPTRYAG